MVAVSGSVGVARTSATVVEKVDCVQQFLRWSMGSPNTYQSFAGFAGKVLPDLDF
jgi:hypothetical protein